MPDPLPSASAAAGVNPDSALARPVQSDLISGRGVVRLKSWLPQPRDGASAVELDGRALPAATGTAIAAEPRTLCLAPGDWLIVSAVLGGPELREELKAYIPQHGFALV